MDTLLLLECLRRDDPESTYKYKATGYIDLGKPTELTDTDRYKYKNDTVEAMDILVEFLEVSLHCILYTRQLYPQGVFEKRTKYNVPVQMCLHPEVTSYITSVMDSLRILLAKGAVDKVSVAILQEANMKPVERFVFELGHFKSSWTRNDPHLFQAEQALRGFLLKLNVSDALLENPIKDTTWTVHVHTKDSTFAAAEEEFSQKDFPWLGADDTEQSMVNAKLVPLRSVSTEMFNMQLYVEEDSTRR